MLQCLGDSKLYGIDCFVNLYFITCIYEDLYLLDLYLLTLFTHFG